MVDGKHFLPGGDHFPEWTPGNSQELLTWLGWPARAGAGSPPGSESVCQGAGYSSWTHKPSAGCPCSQWCSLLPPTGKELVSNLSDHFNVTYTIFLQLHLKRHPGFLCWSPTEWKKMKVRWNRTQKKKKTFHLTLGHSGSLAVSTSMWEPIFSLCEEKIMLFSGISKKTFMGMGTINRSCIHLFFRRFTHLISLNVR